MSGAAPETAAKAKRDQFVAEYLVDLNGSAAALRAGYSESTCRNRAVLLLQDPEIRGRIEDALLARIERTRVNADNVVREYLRLATSDIGELFDDTGAMHPMKDLPKDVRRAIQSVEVEELFEGRGEERVRIGRIRKVRMIDKIRALDMLTKHVGVRDLFPQKVEISVPEGIDVRTKYSEEDRKLLKDLAIEMAKKRIKAENGS
jgi:phage terminase small subunit